MFVAQLNIDDEESDEKINKSVKTVFDYVYKRSNREATATEFLKG